MILPKKLLFAMAVCVLGTAAGVQSGKACGNIPGIGSASCCTMSGTCAGGTCVTLSCTGGSSCGQNSGRICSGSGCAGITECGGGVLAGAHGHPANRSED